MISVFSIATSGCQPAAGQQQATTAPPPATNPPIVMNTAPAQPQTVVSSRNSNFEYTVKRLVQDPTISEKKGSYDRGGLILN